MTGPELAAYIRRTISSHRSEGGHPNRLAISHPDAILLKNNDRSGQFLAGVAQDAFMGLEVILVRDLPLPIVLDEEDASFFGTVVPKLPTDRRIYRTINEARFEEGLPPLFAGKRDGAPTVIKPLDWSARFGIDTETTGSFTAELTPSSPSLGSSITIDDGRGGTIDLGTLVDYTIERDGSSIIIKGTTRL